MGTLPPLLRYWPTTRREVGTAVADLSAVIGDIQGFLDENRELGRHDIRQARRNHRRRSARASDDLKQTLHVAPNRAVELLSTSSSPPTG